MHFLKQTLRKVVAQVKNILAAAKEPLSPLTVDYEDATAWFARYAPDYKLTANYLASRMNRNGVMIDVGANIGYFSWYVMQEIHFTGKCHLFEPVPHLVKLARQTFAKGEFDVLIHPFGLSDENSKVKIRIAADGNLGWNTMITENAQSDMSEILVDVKRFDSLNIGDVDFIKIDTEGAEYRVLKGMLPAIKNMKKLPLMLVEIGWGKGSHPHWNEELAIFHEYSKLGYKFEKHDGSQVDLENLTGTQDIILIAK